ncbi:MAG: hypothetical protein K8S98_16630 [Planctomycetes bacterium]|nr:hypothetical protein [Planctomycetota bacterium]
MELTTNVSSRREGLLVAALIALAVLLHSPSLTWGFFADDYVHVAVLSHALEHPTMRPWSLYDFGVPPAEGSELWRAGAFPWWTDGDWKGGFFRPLASVVRWGTWELFGDAAPAHHAVSLVLFALVLVLAWRVYRVLGLEPRVALLALALVAFEDGAVMPVGWLANQNTLVEAIALLGAVLVGARVEHGASARLVVALLLAFAAALAKESGVVTFALLAFLWRERAPRGAFVALGLGGAYVAAWALAGFGMRSLAYPTPWSDPLGWSSNLVRVVIGASAGVVSPFPVDLLSVGGSVTLGAVVVGLAIGAAVWIPTLRAARGWSGASFWLTFALLALLPQAGTWPSDRLLFVPAIGAAPLIAHAILAARASPRRSLRALGTLLFVVAVPLSAASLAVREFTLRDVAERARTAITSIDLPHDAVERRVVLLQAPSGLVALQPSAVWAVETGAWSTHFFPLQMGRRGLVLKRVGERVLEVESRDEPFGVGLIERVFRTPGRGLGAPDVRSTACFRVTPTLENGGVRQLRLDFDVELEASELAFVGWRDGALRRIAPPALGETLVLEAPPPLAPLMP